ncbi:TPR repeat protein [Microsporum canis CBS 113480]|uniref:TPR repeat protein n=1 Tax=Arthroderma otae (strain ATCC MYA-4605 / CBS 113480) TaxID=554155 RepID=C5FP74_ARTOC|nr:TPR repeat protein [Microsporum canis CBS 113480]EEQ31390.1 TPR repeat protein [Microsporum canis CBS 113480]
MPHQYHMIHQDKTVDVPYCLINISSGQGHLSLIVGPYWRIYQYSGIRHVDALVGPLLYSEAITYYGFPCQAEVRISAYDRGSASKLSLNHLVPKCILTLIIYRSGENMGRFRRLFGLEPRPKGSTKNTPAPQVRPNSGNGGFSTTSQRQGGIPRIHPGPLRIILLGHEATKWKKNLKKGKFDETVKMVQENLELKKREFGEKHEETAAAMYNLSVLFYGGRKLEEAEELSRQALSIFEELLDSHHPSIVIVMSIRTHILLLLDKPEHTVEKYRLALKVSQELHGPEHSDTIIAMDSLAEILRREGEFQEAEGIQRQLLKLKAKLSGPKHSSTLDTMNNLAEVLKSQGQYVEAEELHTQGLQLRKETMGPEHPDTLSTMNNLGLVLSGQGKYQEAEEVHRQELELREKALGPENPLTQYCMVNLTEVLYNQGKFKEALEMHEQAAELSKKVLGPDHPSTLRTLNSLAKARHLRNVE